jgi:hypothetical protein
MAATTDIDHEKEFASAWADPRNTRGERPPMDVNAILAAHYRLSEPLVFTREMLWDMEVRKAYAPDQYIPTVVEPGSAGVWNKHELDNGDEVFNRKSRQRQRLVEGNPYGQVLEAVRINPALEKVTFIGTAEMTDRDGSKLVATKEQPLFHVDHGVAGTQTQPVNLWRIVHITDGPDKEMEARFNRSASVYLYEFIEVYIRDVLKIEPTRL